MGICNFFLFPSLEGFGGGGGSGGEVRCMYDMYAVWV